MVVDDRSLARIEVRLVDARAELAAAQEARKSVEPGSRAYQQRDRIVVKKWSVVGRLERELEAVRLAGANR